MARWIYVTWETGSLFRMPQPMTPSLLAAPSILESAGASLQFCSANLELLTQKRIGLFITCPDTGEKAEKQLRQAFPAELLNGAVVSAYFDGTFDSFRLSILERMMIYRPGGGSGAQLSPSSWKKIKQFAKKMNPSHAEEE